MLRRLAFAPAPAPRRLGPFRAGLFCREGRGAGLGLFSEALHPFGPWLLFCFDALRHGTLLTVRLLLINQRLQIVETKLGPARYYLHFERGQIALFAHGGPDKIGEPTARFIIRKRGPERYQRMKRL